MINILLIIIQLLRKNINKTNYLRKWINRSEGDFNLCFLQWPFYTVWIWYSNMIGRNKYEGKESERLFIQIWAWLPSVFKHQSKIWFGKQWLRLHAGA